MLIHEIAKNSADHAHHDALFGLDILPFTANMCRLTFAFGDLGIGIKNNVQAHLLSPFSTRSKHMSLYETYLWAIAPGNSSAKHNGINKGQGMSLIIDAANSLNISLSIFDANSRGLLNEVGNVDNLSHASARRAFHNIGHDVGFFYYGECLLEKRVH
jgi:hypothetical protein